MLNPSPTATRHGFQPPKAAPSSTQLDGLLLERFIQAFLLARFDNSRPSARFHHECWDLVTSHHPKIAIAAPRGHAKSTSVTFAYVLAGCLFRNFSFPVVFSKTYTIAVEFLRSLKDEIQNNEQLAETFGFARFEKESENDVIFVMKSGHRFRIMASGVDQPVRGLKWGSKRPDVMVLDDIEDDEEVMSDDRREKLMNKFLSAIIPAGSVETKYRVVGTILHKDSLLNNILHDKSWLSRIYEACDDEVSEGSILWPEMYSREQLLAIKEGYVNQERLEKFNMEYRNSPTDKSAALFQENKLLPMNDSDWLTLERNRDWPIAIGGDFAITTKQRRDYTAFVVGVIGPDHVLYIVDVIRKRMGAEELVTTMFETERTWRLHANGQPCQWYEEDGAIRKALGYSLDLVMRKENLFLNLHPMNPGTTDKRTRSMPIRARVQARMVKFDTEATWWPAFKEELLEFDRGTHDDMVDAFAWLGIGISQQAAPMNDEEQDEEEELLSLRKRYERDGAPGSGRNPTCGY